jgi:hypothetical protein
VKIRSDRLIVSVTGQGMHTMENRVKV